MYIHIFVICTVMTVSIEESVTTVQDNVSAVIHMRYILIMQGGCYYNIICSPVAAHIKGADELLICAMPAARNVNIIHLLFALQPML